MTTSRHVGDPAAVLPGEVERLAGVIAAHWTDKAILDYAQWLEKQGDARGQLLRALLAAVTDFTVDRPDTTRISKAWLGLSGITLLEAMKEHQLLGQREATARLARTTVTMRTRPATENDDAIGTTKLGGRPDLPDRVGWPVCSKGSLAFLGQFRLEDLAGTQAALLLPTEGMLSFFIFNDAENGCAGAGLSFPPVIGSDMVRVIHTKDLTNLRRLPEPNDLGEWNQVAPTRLVMFYESLDFPRNSEHEETYELADEIGHWTTNHFFGYAAYKRMDEPEEFRDSFVHFVTFNNVGDLPFAWGDGADLYFYIRDADLQIGKFDAVATYTD
jgi:uncharacterized protein YwqG